MEDRYWIEVERTRSSLLSGEGTLGGFLFASEGGDAAVNKGGRRASRGFNRGSVHISRSVVPSRGDNLNQRGYIIA